METGAKGCGAAAPLAPTLLHLIRCCWPARFPGFPPRFLQPRTRGKDGTSRRLVIFADTAQGFWTNPHRPAWQMRSRLGGVDVLDDATERSRPKHGTQRYGGARSLASVQIETHVTLLEPLHALAQSLEFCSSGRHHRAGTITGQHNEMSEAMGGRDILSLSLSPPLSLSL